MKLALRIVLVLATLAVAAVVALALGLDALVRAAVERGGTHALGVETRLQSADIGLFAGTTEIAGLEIANPPGFEQQPFLSLGRAELAVSLGSLRTDVIEVPVLELSDVTLLLQKREGRTNYGVILDHLSRFESGEEPRAEPGEEGKRFVIRRVEITNVSADLDLMPLGGELTRARITIPRLELEDVGTAEGGATLAQITSRVVQVLLKATLEAGAEVVGPELLSDLEAKLRELGVQAVDLGAGVKGELERMLPELRDRAGEALKGLDESLEGLLKKKNEEED